MRYRNSFTLDEFYRQFAALHFSKHKKRCVCVPCALFFVSFHFISIVTNWASIKSHARWPHFDTHKYAFFFAATAAAIAFCCHCTNRVWTNIQFYVQGKPYTLCCSAFVRYRVICFHTHAYSKQHTHTHARSVVRSIYLSFADFFRLYFGICSTKICELNVSKNELKMSHATQNIKATSTNRTSAVSSIGSGQRWQQRR